MDKKAKRGTKEGLVEKTIAKLDLESLSDKISDMMATKLLSTINTESLAERVLEKHAEKLQAALIECILEKL